MKQKHSGGNLVRRLLRRNISAGQLAGFALANLVGLVIVLIAIQFYRDIATTWNDEDSFISRDYLILSKRVNALGALTGSGQPTFSDAEIDELAACTWARKVGRFNTARFNVNATVDMGGANIGTALFLESIPGDFFDVSPAGWDYTPGSNAPVPVIISKDYLTLYNFGFATSRGLPQISESMIGMVPLRLSLSGNGRQQWVNAKVVGFSSRLNTIAVPEQFMEWANTTFAEPGLHHSPSRLIVEVAIPGDPAVTAYLDSHGYEVAGDKIDNSKAAFFLNIVTSVVIAVGIIISALAFFILLLSIYLLLQKNKLKIHQLMQLGYRPGDIARHYNLLIGAVNGSVLLIASAILILCSAGWQQSLGAIGASSATVWPTLLVGLLIIALITGGSIIAVNRNIKAVFRL